MADNTAVSHRVGYVGLGDMGGGIAVHLAQSGVDLAVFDLNADAIARVVSEGAKPAASLAELAAATDIIVICVLDSAQVKAVVAGPGGLLEHGRRGQVIVIQSTVVPQTVVDVAAMAASHGIDVIDAPVSGNVEDRLNGTLAVIVGGEEDVVARCLPVLEIIGSPVIHVGPLGSGQVAKLANNSITLTTRLAAIEIMRFTAAYGVSEAKLRAVAKASSADSWVLDNWSYFDDHTRAAHGDNAPQVCEAVEAGEARGLEMPLSRAVMANSHAIEAGRRVVLAAQQED